MLFIKDFENVKSRVFMLILYPEEDQTHQSALDFCKSSLDCAYILHDRDEKDSTTHELKKPHYHVVIYFNNPRYKNGVAKLLGIESNYISVWDSRSKALEYLIHLNNFDKFLYDVNDVHGNLKKFLVESISNKKVSDTEAFCILRDFIFSQRDYIYMATLSKFAVKSGLYSFYRKNYNILKDLVNEKNFFKDIKF